MIVKALKNLQPNACWTLDGDDINWIQNESGDIVPDSKFTWLSPDIEIPSKEQLEAEVARLEAELVATEYQRLRAPEYPPLADLADALYHQSKGDNTKMETYLAACEAVKQKYPKGE